MEVCVGKGMNIARTTENPFVWLTSTNYGAAEVCRAALSCLDVHAYLVIRMISMKVDEFLLYKTNKVLLFFFLLVSVSSAVLED